RKNDQQRNDSPTVMQTDVNTENSTQSNAWTHNAPYRRDPPSCPYYLRRFAASWTVSRGFFTSRQSGGKCNPLNYGHSEMANCMLVRKPVASFVIQLHIDSATSSVVIDDL